MDDSQWRIQLLKWIGGTERLSMDNHQQWWRYGDIPSSNQTWQASTTSPNGNEFHIWEHRGIFPQASFEDTAERHKRLITSLYNFPTNDKSMKTWKNNCLIYLIHLELLNLRFRLFLYVLVKQPHMCLRFKTTINCILKLEEIEIDQFVPARSLELGFIILLLPLAGIFSWYIHR